MLAERLLRDHPDVVRDGLQRRSLGDDALATLEQWRALDRRRQALATEFDALAHTPAGAMPDPQRRAELRAAVVAIAHEQRALALLLPNLPASDVPEGSGTADDLVLRAWGDPRPHEAWMRDHLDLATALGILDLPLATRLAGPRFPLLVGEGARLSRVLAAFMLDLHHAAGYTEIAPPHVLRADALTGTGHLPRHANDLYALAADALYLSPTAEAQLVALHAGERIAEDVLPLAYTACTPAFRREAGSAGSANRGLIRQHQFDKVELVHVCTPDDAPRAFDAIVSQAENVLRVLKLPYRVVALCAGDLPFSAERTLDVEVWLPAEQRYLEVSSVSDCGTFQARRLGTRYSPRGGGRTRFVSTLNGSALAIGRTIVALLENGQRAGGGVALPAVLETYFAGGSTLFAFA